MKVLYVGDGRCRMNWGAQATSGALYDILNSEHTVTGIIPSSYKLGSSIPVLHTTLLPISLLTNNTPSAFWDFMWKVSKRIYKTDYIRQDIDESIAYFLKVKDKYSRLGDIYKKIEECDAMVLNGEGTIIFSTPPDRVALFFMFMMKLAQKLGKKTYFLNAMISYSPESTIDNGFVKQMVEILGKCNAIGLRDKVSGEIFHDLAPAIAYKYVPDALFSWRDYFENNYNKQYRNHQFKPVVPENTYTPAYDFNRDYICISGSSATAKFFTKQQAIDSFVALTNKLKELNLPMYLVPTCPGDKFLYKVAEVTGVPLVPVEVNVKEGGGILANARVFVSGRFHPSILASLGNTPCVFMKSNSHKTLSLQEVLEYEGEHIEYEAIPAQKDIDAIFTKVQAILAEGDTLRNKISATVTVLAQKAKAENLELLKK